MEEKKSGGWKKMILLLTLLVWSVSALNVSAYTKQDGANWADARAQENWWRDVDGKYGCQCVDLILAYYDYLVGYTVSGNAKDYAINNLPAGWTRVYSNPEIGDIVVWGPNALIGWGTDGTRANVDNGHIGIIKGVNDDGSISTVETNAGLGESAHWYQRRKDQVSCYIRPNFSDSGTGMRTDYTDLGASFDRIILRTDGWKPLHVSGNNVELRTEEAKAQYHWHFERQSDGSYIITSLYDGRALDVTDAKNTAGTNVGVCVKSAAENWAQRWYLFGQSGNLEFAPKNAMAMRLDTAGGYTADGTNMQIYTANGTTSQKFSLYVLQGTGPKALSLSGTSRVEVGKTTQLSVDYHGATAYKGLIWSSSNETVAKVEDGTVTGVGVGTATITATSTYNDRVSASFNVTTFSTDTEAPVISNMYIWYQNDEKVIIEADVTDNVGVTILSPKIRTAVQENGRYILNVANMELEWVSDTKVRYTIPFDKNTEFMSGERHAFHLVAYDAAGNYAEKEILFDKIMSPIVTMQVGEQGIVNDMVKSDDLSGYRSFIFPTDDIVSFEANNGICSVKALKPGKATIVFMNNKNAKMLSVIIEVKGQGGSSTTPVTPVQPSNPGSTTPAAPAQPSNPGTTTPAAPAQPSNPGTTTPAAPAQPSTPGSTTPAAPAQPSTPGMTTPTAAVVSTTKLPIQTKQGANLKNLINGDAIVGCSSSNNKVLSVNASGKITGKKAGKAVVTVQLASGRTVNVTVTVQKKKVATSKITNLPKSVTLKAKAKKKLSPVLSPITSKDKITYKTSNKKIATVSSKGVITAKKAGKATITVKAGKKAFKVKVTVK